MIVSETVSFRHPVVRDLAWAIASPSLVAGDSPYHAGADDPWCRRSYEEYHPQLLALDSNPSPLLEAIGDPSAMALGTYFEKLVAFWLATGGRYRIILCNRQVAVEGRTMGEFDFILFDEVRGIYCHWETAVKFYLGIGATDSLGAWYGPRKIDRLDLKLARMIGHQIRLGDTPTGGALLASHGIAIGERRVIMKGRLFHPRSVGAHPLLPAGVNPAHLRGWWIEGEEFPRAFGDGAMRWISLPKHRWLAPILPGDEPLLDTARLLRALAEEGFDTPRCVAGVIDGREVERGFIVPAGWRDA